MQTEQQNPNTLMIDSLSTLDMLRVINAEDMKVAQAVQAVLPAVAQAIDAIVERFKRGGRLIYVGAGTSGRLGVLDAVECVPTFGVPPTMVQGILAGGMPAMIRSVEGAEDNPELAREDLRSLPLTADDAVVGIAASGTTPYVIGALEYARAVGAVTIGIACNAPAPVLDAAEIAIGVVVGPEVITGSTRLKSGTAQKLVLNMISTGAMIKLGKVYGNLMVDVQATNIKLVQRAKRIVMAITGLTDDRAAADLLDAADREVKTAIVMHKRGVDAAEARRLLAAAGGMLRAVIG
jgi:N-acetylmuramic acid 6-phosphate etherase